ncbi:sigma-70 family RNA polymerase sigma factor [Cellulomonas sp. JZ18]|nr:sigma-70 family RNA polymerase sigma factor [Cellulomonas sp. JZ18]
MSWAEIVRRHTSLVMARVRQFRLTPQQAEDVAQTVWLNLLEHLADLREPAALPGWIATATRHECIRVTNLSRRAVPVDPTTGRFDVQDDTELDEELLRAERHAALRAALAELPPHQRELLLLLSTDPPPSYQEVSARLGIPIGSIGPTRQRGLARLRRTAALTHYLAAPGRTALGEGGRDVLALG